MNEKIDNYWQEFLDTLSEDSPYRACTFHAEGWGDSPEMAQQLGELIKEGVKTATCSSVWEWEYEGEKWPEPGQLTIVLDGHGDPICIVETTEINICAYNQVDSQFAFDEGEGDRSLQYWREAHQRFFTRGMEKIGLKFSDEMPLVCERFRKIYG